MRGKATYLLFYRGLNIFPHRHELASNAIVNKANITDTILDNRITAMTGHQPNAGVGFTVTGERTVQVRLPSFAKPWDRIGVCCRSLRLEETQEAFKAAKEFEGTAVVIARQPCVISGKRAGIKHFSYFVDSEKCEGCKQCVKFGCPAVEFDEENKCAVITSLCSGCGVCAQICKFEAIREVKR